MQRGATHRCGKQRLPHFALLFEYFLPTLNQCLMIDTEEHFEHLGIHPVQKGGQRSIIQLIIIRRQQCVLVALTPHNSQFFTIDAAQSASNAQVPVGMQKVVSRPRGNAKE